MITSGLLLLADSRLPSGGHGHSGGVEALVDRGLLRDAADLALFLDGRIRTGGPLLASAAAAACALSGLQESHFAATSLQESGFAAMGWARWDAAVSARTPSTA